MSGVHDSAPWGGWDGTTPPTNPESQVVSTLAIEQHRSNAPNETLCSLAEDEMGQGEHVPICDRRGPYADATLGEYGAETDALSDLQLEVVSTPVVDKHSTSGEGEQQGS